MNLRIRAGEVVGLLGDNGAGKSTLLKVITGYHQPTRGVIRVFGEEVRLSSPAVARELGIETVYQDLALIDELTVWRNFFLGKELCRQFGPVRVLRRVAMRGVCAEELSRIGIRRVRSADQRVLGLSGGERQSLAISGPSTSGPSPATGRADGRPFVAVRHVSSVPSTKPAKQGTGCFT